MNKKNILILTGLTLFVGFFIIQVILNSIEFVWVGPSVNTKVLPYVSNTIKKIDNGLDNSIADMNRNGFKMRILYKNAYGSGFLKYNSIPNDLDYSVGIHLGEYSYDGKNGAQIAESIEDKMSTFQSEFYDYVSNLEDKSLLANYDTMSSIVFLSKQKYANIKSINSSIDKVFQNKEYIVHTVKALEDRKDIKLKFPFVLKSNEILIEDSSPIQLFSSDVKYSSDTSRFLREITIVLDFFVDIKNTKTNQIKRIEIVSESFMGQRLQLSRRFFVPIVFVGENSANYLKNLEFLNNDDKYIEYRLFNYKRYLQEFSNLNEMQDRPVKMLKRILQCTELIAPALDEDFKSEIYKNISENLNNRDIQIMNDYSTALGNLMQIVQLDRLFFQAYESGEIYRLVVSMNDDLKELESRKTVNQDNLNDLIKFQKEIINDLKSIKNQNDLIKFNNELFIKMQVYNPKIINIFKESMKKQGEILAYIDRFNDIFIKAGFHKVDMYWLNDDTLGVVRDDFTKNIKPDELKSMALQNGLADVNYVFINKSQAPKICVRYSTWVRYNSTPQEEINWLKLKKQLLSDKTNFNIKKKFILKF